jgi:hypothetical protein
VIPLEDDPGALSDFLREGKYLPMGSEGGPKALALALRTFLRDMRDNEAIETVLSSFRACPLCRREY